MEDAEAQSEDPICTVAPELIAEWADEWIAVASLVEAPRLTEVFRDILWTANHYVPSESASICLAGMPGAGDDLLYVAALGGCGGAIVGERLPAGQGITGRVFREGRSALVNDVRSDPEFFSRMDERSSYETRTLLAVPVRFRGETTGVISLFNRLGAVGFTEQDRRLIEIQASYASNSLLNLADAAHHREIARRDDLTGLRNDRYFHQQLRVELERRELEGGELSLIFLDLDRFKGVVDTHGHLVGSQVLSEVGRLIARVAENPRATLARYGGDEFVAVLPGIGCEEAGELAERIRLAIADTVFLAEPGPDGRPSLNLKGAFSASIGVASYCRCGFAERPFDDWKARQRDFIQAADVAMYRAKHLGRDQVCLA